MTNSPLTWSFRVQFLAGFAACFALVAYALHTQINGGLLPCPLCIFQRVAFAALGVAFLVGGLHAPRGSAGRRAWGLLAALVAVAGGAIAARHVWLQHLPSDEVPACGPGLEWMLETTPLAAVVREVLTGSGECAEVDWAFLGLSMPAWSLVWFLLLGAWALHAGLRRR